MSEETKEFQVCIKCNEELISHQIEIYNTLEEVGGYCDNEKCERYLLLVV